MEEQPRHANCDRNENGMIGDGVGGLEGGGDKDERERRHHRRTHIHKCYGYDTQIEQV